MQISDFLYKKQTSYSNLPSIDPSYLLDLKKHLDQNKDYIKQRIEWRKTRPEIWSMKSVKEEFFKVFCETDLQVFHRDIEFFLMNHQGISVKDGAKMFCAKFRGYEMTYGVEFVERAMRRCEL